MRVIRNRETFQPHQKHYQAVYEEEKRSIAQEFFENGFCFNGRWNDSPSQHERRRM